MNDHRGLPPFPPSGDSQPAHRKTDRVYPKRVPSALTVERQRDAVRQVRAGRSVHQVAAEFSVSETVIFELWQRDTQKRAAEFQRSFEMKLEEIDEEMRGWRVARRSAA